MALDDGERSAEALGREALAHVDSLHNFARYLTGNDADAQDLVQETWSRALRAAAQFTPGTNLKAWLFRILRNAWTSHHRRERALPTTGGLDALDPPAEEPLLRGDQELHRLRGIVAREIEEALMSLPEDARAVILLDLEGLSESETAEALGCPVGTVKSRLSRARAALRRRLADYARER